MSKFLILIKRPQLFLECFEVCLDILKLRLRYGFLRKKPTRTNSLKKVLIVSLGDGISQIKIETILAKALEVNSSEIFVLTRRNFHFAKVYFKSFGINRFIYLEEFLDTINLSNQELPEVLNQASDRELKFQDVLNLIYRGVYIGRHVLSTIIRAKKGCSISLENKETKEMCLEGLRNSIQITQAAERILDELKPDLVLFMERGYSPYGEFFDTSINRKLNTVQWLHAQRRDTIAFKRFDFKNRHFHAFSVSAKSWERLRNMEWSIERDSQFMGELKDAYVSGSWYNRKFLHQGKVIKPADQVRWELNLNVDKKTAVIFSHVLWDATFFYGENLFKDYEDWLIQTLKAAQLNTNVNWVIKIHPDYIWKMKQMGDRGEPADLISIKKFFGKLPDSIKLLMPETDISTYSLFNVIDYGITVRGTIGMELPCFGIPVLTAGSGRYSNLGFTIDSNTREEYLERIRLIHQIPRMDANQISLARKHAYSLFFLRPLQFHSFEMTQKPFKEQGQLMDHNIEYKISSWDQLCYADDLTKFSNWCLNSQEPDYLTGE